MKIFFFLFALTIGLQNLRGKENIYSEERFYQNLLLKKVGEKLPDLAGYPSLLFPNQDYESIPSYFPQTKVLLFGYGSLINKQSASRSVKSQSLETMRPAIAFGVKRVFNYQAAKTDHWGQDQHQKEKAMANLTPTLNMCDMVNGIVLEIDNEDLAKLVQREKGYDLIPILITSWEDFAARNNQPEIQVAYTFIASSELRNNIIYTSTRYYPVREYLHAIQEGALEYGETFAHFWNMTTFLADGTTPLNNWDETTFEGILCTKQSID